mmetsp:Transcript_16374/g.62222  ORF Transcript_16374/g.62222 Transcript_16374/m.62222 type:complete len:305 (+) Transcript_16374:733-1647(+)
MPDLLQLIDYKLFVVPKVRNAKAGSHALHHEPLIAAARLGSSSLLGLWESIRRSGSVKLVDTAGLAACCMCQSRVSLLHRQLGQVYGRFLGDVRRPQGEQRWCAALQGRKDVFLQNSPPGAGATHRGEVDAVLTSQPPDRWRRQHALWRACQLSKLVRRRCLRSSRLCCFVAGGPSFWQPSFVVLGDVDAGVGAGVGVNVDVDEWLAHRHDGALRMVHRLHRAGVPRGDLGRGFVRLHLADGVELAHAVARLHEPLQQLHLGDPLANVGQNERLHGRRQAARMQAPPVELPRGTPHGCQHVASV